MAHYCSISPVGQRPRVCLRPRTKFSLIFEQWLKFTIFPWKCAESNSNQWIKDELMWEFKRNMHVDTHLNLTVFTFFWKNESVVFKRHKNGFHCLKENAHFTVAINTRCNVEEISFNRWMNIIGSLEEIPSFIVQYNTENNIEAILNDCS